VLSSNFNGVPAPFEAYNSVLGFHHFLDKLDINLMFENAQIGKIARNQLDIEKPTMGNLNAIIAKAITGVTANLRHGDGSDDMQSLYTKLVPFPRLHFMTTGVANFVGSKPQTSSVNQLVENAVRPDNFMVGYKDFDAEEDPYMAVSLHAFGGIKGSALQGAAEKLKRSGKISFVEWCPTGFNMVNQATSIPNAGGAGLSDKSVTMIGNNCAFVRKIEEIDKKYDMMYAQRAYVHTYVGEGMEEGWFSEAREDLGFLEKDYLDVQSEQASDEVNPDDEFRRR